MGLFLLDEQLANPKLVTALTDRGYAASTVGDAGVTGRTDPNVIRGIQRFAGSRPWVLVTMDLTVVEEYAGFDWGLYAIAWVVIPEELLGSAVEKAKANVIHRHAHLIDRQAPGDHQTYALSQHFRSRPSLTSMLRRR